MSDQYDPQKTFSLGHNSHNIKILSYGNQSHQTRDHRSNRFCLWVPTSRAESQAKSLHDINGYLGKTARLKVDDCVLHQG